MANTMQVSLVAADREVWSGEATVVNARTLAGEIGIMANHQPIMSVLAAGQVDVRTVDDGHWVAAVDGGFISVANNQVRLLCEYAELSHESDYEEAKRLLDERKARDEGADGGSERRHDEASRSRKGGRCRSGSGCSTSAGVVLGSSSLYGIALIVRRRVLARHGGTFELSYRARTAKAGRGWVLGLGRYSGDDPGVVPDLLALPAPASGSGSAATSRTSAGASPSGVEQLSLYPGHVVIRCTHPRR